MMWHRGGTQTSRKLSQRKYTCILCSATLERTLIGQGVPRPGKYVIPYVPPAATGVLGASDYVPRKNYVYK